MVIDWQVFGAEVGYLPLMAQAEAQDKFVDEFGFPVSSHSRHHNVPPGLKSAVRIKVFPTRIGTTAQPVFEERTQVFPVVLGGEYAFQRDLFGLRQSDEKTFSAVKNQMFIGVLASGAEVYQAATLRSQAADEFMAQRLSGSVLVGSDVNHFLGFEVRLHEPVHPCEVALRTGGHGDDVFPPGSHEGAGIEFAFGDDALRSVGNGVDIVWDEFGAGHHSEVFQCAAVLGVDEYTILEVIEAEAILYLVATR